MRLVKSLPSVIVPPVRVSSGRSGDVIVFNKLFTSVAVLGCNKVGFVVSLRPPKNQFKFLKLIKPNQPMPDGSIDHSTLKDLLANTPTHRRNR